MFPFMNVPLLTTDFDEISRSGYCLITNGQSLLNKPNISDNYWIIKSYSINKIYFLTEVTNLKGQKASRICNAGIWGDWIYE